MKLIRWMLSNLILIIIVLALVYVYVYWDDLAAEDTPAGKIIASLSDEYTEVRDFVAAIKAKDSGTAVSTANSESAVPAEETVAVIEPQSAIDNIPEERTAQPADRYYDETVDSAPAGGNDYNAPVAVTPQATGNYYNAPASARPPRGGNYYNAPAQRADNYYNAQPPAPVLPPANVYNAQPPAPVTPPANVYNAPAARPISPPGQYYNAPVSPPVQAGAEQVESAAVSTESAEPSPATQTGADSATTAERFVPPEVEMALNRVSVDGKISGAAPAAASAASNPVDAGRPAHGQVEVTPPGVTAAVPAADDMAKTVVAAATNTTAEAASAVSATETATQQAPASSAAGEPAIKSTSGVDAQTRALWLDARRAFLKRDYETCERNYKQLIAANKDNMDAYGELGNVYFNQGKREQAAAVYYEAAAIMVRQGQLRRAASLSGLLHHLDQSRAQQLKTLLDGAVKPNS